MDARVLFAVGVAVLGTMYMWTSPAFVKATDVRPGAPSWSQRFFASAPDEPWSQALLRTTLLVVALFAVAAFGLYRGTGEWWVWVGLAAAVLSLLVALPWWAAVGTSAPAMTVFVNVVLLLWSAGLVVSLAAPGLRRPLLRALGVG